MFTDTAHWIDHAELHTHTKKMPFPGRTAVILFSVLIQPSHWSVTAVLLNFLIFLLSHTVSLSWTINSCTSLDSRTCWEQWKLCWIAKSHSRSRDPSASCGDAGKQVAVQHTVSSLTSTEVKYDVLYIELAVCPVMHIGWCRNESQSPEMS